MKDFDLIGRSKIWLGISAGLMVASFIAIAIFGLNLGIDFTGGSLIELTLENEFNVADVRSVDMDGYIVDIIEI